MSAYSQQRILSPKPSGLSQLLRPEVRPRLRLDTSTPKGSQIPPLNSSKSQTRAKFSRIQISPELQGRTSSPSARSTDQIDDTESGALSSKLVSSKASGGRPQLPRLGMPQQRTDFMPPPQTASHAGRRAIRLPTPMCFPQSTKNANSNQANKFEHLLKSNQGLTPSSRAMMQAQTNISSRENEDDASLRYGQTSNTGRFGTAGLLMSPTGGGSRSIQINTAISQHVDVPEELEDEEIRSVSTLYNAADQRRKAEQLRQKELSQQKNRLEMIQENQKQFEKEEEDDDQIVLAEPQSQSFEKPGAYPRTVSTQNNNNNVVEDSFTNFFAKQRNGVAGDSKTSSLATGEKPWYYFDGNNTGSSLNKSQKTAQEMPEVEQVSAIGSKEFDDKVQQAQNRNLPPRAVVTPVKFSGNSKSQAGQNSQSLQKQSSASVQNKESAASGGVVIDLYSNSHMNTPNMPRRKAIQDSQLAEHLQVDPPKNENGSLYKQKPQARNDENEEGGRMTLRSVHLSSTEDMKVEKAVNSSVNQNDAANDDNQHQNENQDQMMPLSPAITVRKPKASKVMMSTPVEQNGIQSALDIQDHHINLKMENRVYRKPNAGGVSSSHQDNLFVTTEKARLQKQNLDSPFHQGHIAEESGSPANYKIQYSNNAATINTSLKQQAKIQTPSFISSEMMQAKQRRSDLLLKKKEPSQINSNRRNSLDGQDQAEDLLSMDHSICSPGLRESRFSQGGTQQQQAAAMIVNQIILRNSLGNVKDRPVIFGAGSPAAIQPNIRETESSCLLAASSRFSQQLQSTIQSVKGIEKSSQELPNGSNFRSFKSSKRKPNTNANASAIRHSSSFSKKSIRKSTADGEDKEVTSFAHYMQNLFANLFGCCNTGATQQPSNSDNSNNLRQSLNSSVHSNMLRYSFVAVPNHNSISLESSNKEQSNVAKSGGANGKPVHRRSKLIQDFKGEQKRSDKQSNSILDRNPILEEEKLEQQNKQIVVHCRESLQSDIVDVEDDDNMPNAQLPIDSQRNAYRAPGDRIENSNQRGGIHNSSQQTTTERVSSNQRITAGTVEIATQLTQDSQVDEFVFQKPAEQTGNPFQVRPLRQYLADDDDGENGEENYNTSASPAKGPASQLPHYSSNRLPQKAQVSNYEVPQQFRDDDSSPIDSDLDYQKVQLPVGAIASSNSADSPEKTQENAQKRKNILKDRITQVPQSLPAKSQGQTRVTKAAAQEDLGSSPSLVSQEQASSGSREEEDAMSSELNDGNSDEEYEEGDETPDVQKIHFNQTVQALFNIRATGLTMPPFHQIRHQLVDLPEPNHPSKTKTVVFDLDETLIHCVDDVDADNPDVVIPIQFSEEPEPVLAGINIRPYARECLEAANEHFQVVIFTASEQEYADPIIDYLDPERKLVQARYYRPSCVRTRNPDFYIKDMRIFHQRSLADIILVDNSVYSFAFQLDNGVPIVSFYNDPKDEEMLHLKFYLECLKDCDDVREKNKEAFQLMQLAETQLQRIIQEQNRLLQQQNQVQQMSAVSPSYSAEDDDESYSPYQHNYRLPEQAQYIDANNFVLEENEEDEDDELARDPNDRTAHEMRNDGAAKAHKQNIYAQQANGNIMEEEEEEDDDEYEEEESFECRL